jgi:hypothetical protein
VLRLPSTFHVGDSPMVNAQYVRKPAKGIRELAKYMTKAASPKKVRLLRGGRGEFVDPVLAARAEVAFSGDRLFECMGAWRGTDDDEESAPDDDPASCERCGARAWRGETICMGALLNELPPEWIPRFGRAGPVRTKPLPARAWSTEHV